MTTTPTTPPAPALLARLSELDAALVELASPEFMRNYQAMEARLEAADKLADHYAQLLTRVPHFFLAEEDALTAYRPAYRAAYRNPAPAAEGWCPVCGFKDGLHLRGCEARSEMP